MTGTTTFPLNAWYAAAWDFELGRSLLARTICDRKLVMYRTLAGQAVALENTCWHRLVPLSGGRLAGDDVVCPYHGLAYNAQGRCVHMPSQETINPSAAVRSFPVVERHRFLWVWPGDPALADPALVPDMMQNDHPAWVGDGGRIPVACNYRLVVDNLMDLTHETFVHAGSIGDRSVAETPFEATHGDGTATVTRWMENIDPPPFWVQQLGKPGPVDRWQIIHFEAPCTVMIDVGVAPAGTGARGGDRSRGVNGYVLNTITPETEGTCHYFWAFARNYDLGSQRRTTELCNGVKSIFREDEVMLEAQQRAIDAHPDHVFYNLNIDSGALWARRAIDTMIRRERPPRVLAAE